jgi:hypothetical protein
VVIPLVRELSKQVGDEVGKYVHWGATSQTRQTLRPCQIRRTDLLISDRGYLCNLRTLWLKNNAARQCQAEPCCNSFAHHLISSQPVGFPG